MKYHALLGAFTLVLLIGATPGDASPSRAASVAIIWRVPAPPSSDEGVRAVEAGMSAVGELNAQLNALNLHSRARVTIAFDPQFIAALEQLAAGNSTLAELADGRLTAADPRAADLLNALSAGVVVDQQFAQTPAGKRFAAHATAARLALMGDRAAHFSTRDEIDFAGSAVLLALISSGYARAALPLLKKDDLNGRDLHGVADAFAHAARDQLTKIKRMAENGSLELAALPAYEPIVPLVIDAAGRTRDAAFTVNLGGRSDAAAAIEEGMRAITLLDGDVAPGIISPHGAYDDEAAAVMQEQHPGYAVFSDRVAKGTTGASADAVNASKAAALHGYLLETSKTSKLPILFCSDTMGAALDVLPDSASATALGDHVRDMAAHALQSAAAHDPTILVLCLDLGSALLHRPDRAQMLAHLSSVLDGQNGIEATTLKEFLRRHPPTAQTYGFEPASDGGGFALWMGSANQASLWTALSDARKSAGGDAALKRGTVRDALLRAESERWFVALMLPQPRAAVERTLTQFRSAIARIYQAANVAVPAQIAPVKWDRPATIATPPPARV